MATPRFATLVHVEAIAPEARALTFATRPDDRLLFVGGQYLIVDTGLVAPSGKAVKRAYSLLSSDSDTATFTLASQRLPGGPGSGYLHALSVGDEIKFSGPWGKMVPADVTGRSLVLATDTGITATLGLVRAQRFANQRARTRFVWLRADPAAFLSEAFVRERLPAELGTIEIGRLPPAGHPERLAHVRTWLGQNLSPGALEQIFIAGDGAVNYALLDEFTKLGVSATRDNVESFFNYPKKTAEPTAAPATAPAATTTAPNAGASGPA